MICHLPSSQLSPGPIHYCCRLPLCSRCVRALALLDNVYRQANVHMLFPPHVPFPVFKSSILQLRRRLISCHLRRHTDKTESQQSCSPVERCPPRKQRRPVRRFGKSDLTLLAFPRLALSGTWLTSLCGICFLLHASCFLLCQTSSSWT